MALVTNVKGCMSDSHPHYILGYIFLALAHWYVQQLENLYSSWLYPLSVTTGAPFTNMV